MADTCLICGMQGKEKHCKVPICPKLKFRVEAPQGKADNPWLKTVDKYISILRGTYPFEECVTPEQIEWWKDQAAEYIRGVVRVYTL